jgi:Pex19 protein family
MIISPDEQARLDAALDTALDDLDSDEEDEEEEAYTSLFNNDNNMPRSQQPPSTTRSDKKNPVISPNTTNTDAGLKIGPSRPPTIISDSDIANLPPDVLFSTMLQQMMDDGMNGSNNEKSVNTNDTTTIGIAEDEFLGRFMTEIQTRLHSEMAQMDTPPQSVSSPSTPQLKSPTKSNPASKNSVSKPTNKSTDQSTKMKSKVPKSTSGTLSENDEMAAAISKLVNGLAKQMNTNDDDDEIDDLPDMDSNDMLNCFMESLMASTTATGNDGTNSKNAGGDENTFNPDAVIDGMMGQLLSKDLMYEPMKQVATEFPTWLEERSSSLSPEEFSRYVFCTFVSLDFTFMYKMSLPL